MLSSNKQRNTTVYGNATDASKNSRGVRIWDVYGAWRPVHLGEQNILIHIPCHFQLQGNVGNELAIIYISDFNGRRLECRNVQWGPSKWGRQWRGLGVVPLFRIFGAFRQLYPFTCMRLVFKHNIEIIKI